MKCLSLATLFVLLPSALTQGGGQNQGGQGQGNNNNNRGQGQGQRTTFYMKSEPKCSGDIHLMSVTAECDRECTYGSTFNFDAYFVAMDTFDEEVEVTVKTCLMSTICKQTYQATLNTCEIITPGSNQTNCTEPGDYYVSGSITLPDDDGYTWYYGGYGVSVSATIESENVSSVCYLSLTSSDGQNNQRYRMAVTAASVFLLAGVGGLTYFIGKKRCIACISPEEEEEKTLTDFEMMKDPIRTGTTV